MTFRPNQNVHRFAVFTACCTFLLLVAGALVTSNDAGLSVPDWPLSYGSLAPPMVGGIFYEHGHRMIAAFVGMLSIILAAWLHRVEPRAWVRWVGITAVGAVIAQGILGGITVLFFLPAPISAAHATLAQIFFCTIVSIALFTSAWWERQSPASGPASVDHGERRVHTIAAATVALTLVKLVLGGLPAQRLRHHPALDWRCGCHRNDFLAGRRTAAPVWRHPGTSRLRARVACADWAAIVVGWSCVVVAGIRKAIPSAYSRDGDAHCFAHGIRRAGACDDRARDAGLLSLGGIARNARGARKCVRRIVATATGGLVKAAQQRLGNSSWDFSWDSTWVHQ